MWPSYSVLVYFSLEPHMLRAMDYTVTMSIDDVATQY